MGHGARTGSALAHHHVGTQIQEVHDQRGVQLVHDLRPVGQAPRPQLWRRAEQVEKTKAVIVAGPGTGGRGVRVCHATNLADQLSQRNNIPDLASKRPTEEVVVVEVTVTIREHGVRRRIDEVEVVEGLEDNDQVPGLDEAAGRRQVPLAVKGTIHQGQSLVGDGAVDGGGTRRARLRCGGRLLRPDPADVLGAADGNGRHRGVAVAQEQRFCRLVGRAADLAIERIVAEVRLFYETDVGPG